MADRLASVFGTEKDKVCARGGGSSGSQPARAPATCFCTCACTCERGGRAGGARFKHATPRLTGHANAYIFNAGSRAGARAALPRAARRERQRAQPPPNRPKAARESAPPAAQGPRLGARRARRGARGIRRGDVGEFAPQARRGARRGTRQGEQTYAGADIDGEAADDQSFSVSLSSDGIVQCSAGRQEAPCAGTWERHLPQGSVGRRGYSFAWEGWWGRDRAGALESCIRTSLSGRAWLLGLLGIDRLTE